MIFRVCAAFFPAIVNLNLKLIGRHCQCIVNAPKVSVATEIVDMKRSLRKSNAKVKVEAVQNR